jgi:twinkle protein
MEIREIVQRLNDRAEETAVMLLPAGRREGREWTVGNVQGEQGRSLKVCIEGTKKGVWSDFAAGEGGDFLDLWQIVKGITLPESIREAKRYLGIQEPAFEKLSAKSYRKPTAPKGAKKVVEQSPVQKYLMGRGLTLESINAYRLAEVDAVGPWEGWKKQQPWKGPWIVIPSFRGKELVSVKYLHLERPDGKKQTIVEPGCEPCLFGWQAITENSRAITLCEGEIDAVTLFQYGFPALSVPFGGGTGNKQQWIDNEFPHLDQFEEIFLALDMDEEGEKATREIINRLGAHRCKVVRLPRKDANDCLQQGVTREEICACFAVAESMDPGELKSPTAFRQVVIEEFFPPGGEPPGILAPWRMKGKPVRFHRGEVTVWSGRNGHGKSLVLNQLALAAMEQRDRVCIASFEMHPRKTLSRMIRQALGKGDPERAEIESTLTWLDGKLWIFDLLGTAKVEKMMEVFRYAFHRYGVQQFIIDSLLKCGIASDDYKEQKAFLDLLNDFANATNSHVHLVAHSRKAENELTPPGKMDVKGSGDISDLASNVWSVWRNRVKEEDLSKIEANEPMKMARKEIEKMPDALLMSVKARDDRNEEGKIGLYFHKPSLQYLSRQNEEPQRYCVTEVQEDSEPCPY